MTVDRILVFAPHPDDEILGCGGYLALKRTENAAIRIIVVSDGALGLAPIQPINQHCDNRKVASVWRNSKLRTCSFGITQIALFRCRGK